jgi:hypothetical protein
MDFIIPILAVFVLILGHDVVDGNPSSKPYIPFRTDPYDQTQCHHSLNLENNKNVNERITRKVRVYEPDKDNQPHNDQCPLQFALGVSRRTNHDAAPPGLGGRGFGNNWKGTASSPLGIEQPPVIYPVLPWQGPGRQVLFTTQYEHLDMLTPSKGDIQVTSATTDTTSTSQTTNSNKAPFSKSFIAEGLMEHVEFPLLFESSAFQTSPILGDINRDGILDAILTDYHGGIYAIGLQVSRDDKKRYFHKAQVPRLYVRRQWMESMVNETLGIDPYEAEKIAEAEEEERARIAAAEAAEKGETIEGEPKDETKTIRAREERRQHDPYHSYFEYTYGSGSSSDHEPILRGVTADLLGQDQDHVEGLEERRKRRVSYERKIVYDSAEEDQKQEKVVYDSFEEEEKLQKVVYDSIEEEQKNQNVVFDSVVEEQKMEKVVYDSVEEERNQEKVVFDSLEEEQKNQKVVFDSVEDERNKEEVVYDSVKEEQEQERRNKEEVVSESPEIIDMAEDLIEAAAESKHRRLQEVHDEDTEASNQLQDDATFGGDDFYRGYEEGNEDVDSGGGEMMEGDVDVHSKDLATDSNGDTAGDTPSIDQDDVYREYRGVSRGDDTYPRYDDYSRYDKYDDYYGGRHNSFRENYYDEKHYVRLPPHILCTPTLIEMPKLYSTNGEVENLLLVAVSYYFDEDEYEGFFSYKRFEHTDHGDETECT